MDEQNLNILERIHAFYYQLTASERKVADFVLANHDRVQLMSITQLAEECGTADATISRFCRNLDLKGFNAFKLELALPPASISYSPRTWFIICSTRIRQRGTWKGPLKVEPLHAGRVG